MMYLDNAATSWPKPESVYQTMDEFLRRKGGNPNRSSHSLAAAASRVVEETRQAPIISFNLNGSEPGEVGAILDQAFDIKVRTGLHCAPAAHKTLGTFPRGTIRLSPGYLNNVEEINYFLQSIKKIARSATV